MIELPKSPLLTDLYQLTMLQGYFEQGMNDIAVFEFFVRRLPPNRGFLLAAGLEQVLAFLEILHFSGAELEWVRDSGRFSRDFPESLAKLRFTGDVHAMPEGTVFFADEPILRVTAPLPQAQLVESRIINLLHFQTLIASKAARVVLAAPGKLLVDFGLRRAHGAEAALLAARASYLAGFQSTSNVLAGAEFNIPVAGTMAHSFIQAHDSETLAFEHFARAQPENVILLIDTYDTEAAAREVVHLAPRLEKMGIAIKAVRLDSGDLAEHSRNVRRILDNAGLKEIRIFSSGSLDEYAVQNLLARGAPIDGFGIGTHMATSSDAPFLDCAYKLEEYAGRPRRKRSEGKATWPGRKQVYRTYGAGGAMSGDVLTLDDDPTTGTALIVPVMRDGRRIRGPETLEDIRRRSTQELARLPAGLRARQDGPPYPVIVAKAVRELAAKLDRQSMQN
ncbi:MAG: nicotinate phosphoribosyltransferase [Sulfuricaulis sp.]|uniref:nicotinate phosphoribosyltransferase n=1 Tax=Sulfuricaulis sp. TaxID=2003553 RepID=UPI0034A2FEA3